VEYYSVEECAKPPFHHATMLTADIRSFLLVLLTCKIGFLVNDSVTGLKLLEKGLSKEDLAVAVLLDFPAQMIVGWLVAKWSRPSPGKHPLTGTGDILRPWIMAFWARLGMAVIATAVVYFFPKDGNVEGPYFSLIVATTLMSSLTRYVLFYLPPKSSSMMRNSDSRVSEQSITSRSRNASTDSCSDVQADAQYRPIHFDMRLLHPNSRPCRRGLVHDGKLVPRKKVMRLTRSSSTPFRISAEPCPDPLYYKGSTTSHPATAPSRQ